MQFQLQFRRAQDLSISLAEEKVVWNQKNEKLKSAQQYQIGDTLLAAAQITYFGHLPQEIRQTLLLDWQRRLSEKQSINISGTPALQTLANSLNYVQLNQEIQDKVAIVNHSPMFILCIDPERCASAWVKKYYLNLTILRSH